MFTVFAPVDSSCTPPHPPCPHWPVSNQELSAFLPVSGGFARVMPSWPSSPSPSSSHPSRFSSGKISNLVAPLSGYSTFSCPCQSNSLLLGNIATVSTGLALNQTSKPSAPWQSRHGVIPFLFACFLFSFSDLYPEPSSTRQGPRTSCRKWVGSHGK